MAQREERSFPRERSIRDEVKPNTVAQKSPIHASVRWMMSINVSCHSRPTGNAHAVSRPLTEPLCLHRNRIRRTQHGEFARIEYRALFAI